MRVFNRTLLAGVLATALAGTAIPAMATPPGYEADTRAYNLARGRVIFTENCLRCHEQGRNGAPIPDDPEDWSARIEQPLATLIEHAISGHGDMPARGETALSDQDIAAAVAYVVNRARIVVAERLDSLPAPAGGFARADQAASIDDAVVQMFLLLMGKDRWK
jgi:cytochrome c5